MMLVKRHDDAAARPNPANRGIERCRSVRVEPRQRIVEQEQEWRAVECPRERYPLALAGRQDDPALPDHRCIPIR